MLETVSSSAYDLITSSRFWMILLVAIFFLVVAVYVYNKHVSPMVNNDFIPNNEFQKKDEDDTQNVELYIFTVEWCPHSKKAIPIWEQLKAEYNNKPFNNHNIIFIQVDGEENPELADKYKVEGYPTIKLIKGDQIIEYDAKPSIEHLKEFLNSTLS
jgi:thiol-disulfide isomerase/thioredoxin